MFTTKLAQMRSPFFPAFLFWLLALAGIFALTGCNLAGGGVAGRMVQDGLPPTATIYKPEIDKLGETRHKTGTEDTRTTELIWKTYKFPVPCTDIKGVEYWTSGNNSGEIGLRLVGQKYGGKYYPPPQGISRFWLRPQLWADRDQPGNSVPDDFTEAEARQLSAYCGVDFQLR